METVDGNAAGSRWNPTKEQITMLEGLYKQGIRTPSADQIQQITTRLQAYGHIEGKNVFYWFQNHKARQRQKQKQESMIYFNHFLQRTPPIFIPPPPPPGPPCNNVCNPYYIPVPQHGIGYYPQYPKVPLQTNARRRKKMYNDGEKRSRSYNEGEKANGVIALGWNQKDSQPNIIMNKSGVNEEIMNTTFNGDETLALFPLHPTGILDEKSSRNCIPTSSAENPNPCHSFENGIEECSGDQPFFNFFGSKGAD